MLCRNSGSIGNDRTFKRKTEDQNIFRPSTDHERKGHVDDDPENPRGVSRVPSVYLMRYGLVRRALRRGLFGIPGLWLGLYPRKKTENLYDHAG